MKTTCPECNKSTESDVSNGYVQCRGCHQMLLVENNEVKKVIPKAFIA
jgi:tRNA(Ile2) C34 agmatinyltransferase TiaS